MGGSGRCDRLGGSGDCGHVLLQGRKLVHTALQSAALTGQPVTPGNRLLPATKFGFPFVEIPLSVGKALLEFGQFFLLPA